MHAILKAADLCATEPERAARQLIEGGFAQHDDIALQTLTDVPYNVWRELDPEDSLRFYALWPGGTGEEGHVGWRALLRVRPGARADWGAADR